MFALRKQISTQTLHCIVLIAQDASPDTNEDILQVKDILENGPLTLDKLFGMTPQSPFMANNFCYTVWNWEFPEEGEGQCAIAEYPLSDDINFGTHLIQ